MKTIQRWLHLTLILGLAFGLAFAPASPAVPAVQAQDVPPPAEELGLPAPAPAAPAALPPELLELQAALDAFELARQAGPEAVLALGETLRGRARDALMADLQAARAELARTAPPQAPTAPVSPEEETAINQAQAEQDQANRPAPLLIDPALGLDENPAPEPSATEMDGDAKVDRTVGTPPCTYATISAAMTAASEGDRLLLEGGRTFNENLSVRKSLTFQGGYAGCGSASSAVTTLNGSGTGRVMYIYENLTIGLENLIITNGSTTGWGAGIIALYNTLITANNVEILNNNSTSLGGGLFLNGASATFTNSNIHDNSAVAGAGVYGVLNTAIAPSLNLLSYADVYNNQALSGSGYGGGIFLDQGTASLAECSDIYGNDAILGGGAYLVTSTLTVAGDCSEIESNTATGNGGGIYALTSTVNLDDQAELYYNRAGYGGGAGSGGGAYLDDSTLMGDSALILYNTATTHGGGVYATNTSLLDMDLGGYPCSGPRCSQLSQNTAYNLYGGGVYATLTSEVDLRQVFIESNTASMGGGIYVFQSPLYLYNSLLARNDASGGTGDGLRIFTDSSLLGSHNTLANNNTNGTATGYAVAINGGTLNLSNSIIWNHTTSIDLAGQTVTCSNVQGGYTGTGNLNLNPQFVSPAEQNYHLIGSSPLIDRCATGQTLDFDNESRPVVYQDPAAPYDMGADEAGLRVGVNGAGCAYGRLQDAIDAAVSGDTIQVMADYFMERVTVSAKNLTIAGGYAANCKSDLDTHSFLNGSAAGSVFLASNSLLTLRNLVLLNGDSGNGGGLNIQSGAQVTLDDTDIISNHADNGGGVYISSSGLLTLTNDSDISNNIATLNGGGARVWGRLVGNNPESQIYSNMAVNGGGVSVPGGVLDLEGSPVMNNLADLTTGLGGGIHATSAAVVTLLINTNVSGNQAFNGAGIYSDGAELHLTSANIHSNTAANDGGGIYLANSSTLTATDAFIGTPTSISSGNVAVHGAGLYVSSSTLNFDGQVVNNIASSQGGGVYATAATLNLSECKVGGSAANLPNQLSSTGHEGAGLYLSGATTAAITNCDISSNAFQTTGYTYGGGILITGSTLTLTGSTIQLHQAPSASDGRGAGMYIDNSTVTLDNTSVLSNAAGAVGGGLRVFDVSTVNILNGSELNKNLAISGEGGAVAATGTPDINISSSSLTGNTAGTDGGALYLNAGTLDFTEWWDLSDNQAGGDGGALAVVDTGNAGFYSTTAGSSLIGNIASGNGGALYLNNTSSLELYSTSGYLLSLSGNYAGGSGGAAFADGGGLLDIYGNVVVTANRAPNGNGGAFYLSNNSRIWLDDYVQVGPDLRVNWAQNGGAIYALNSPSVQCDGANFGYSPSGNYTTLGSGGAIYLQGSSLDADNCTFLNNQALEHGGAIAAYTSTLNIHASFPSLPLGSERQADGQLLGPQIILATNCNPLAGPCSGFSGNLADSDSNTSGSGGAIYNSDSNLTLAHTILHHNQAQSGGAIYQAGAASSALVFDTLVHHNTSMVSLGAGIRRTAGSFTLRHTTLADNTGGSGFSGEATLVENSIAWGNSAAGFSTIPLSSSCNIDDGGNAGINLDPLFVLPGVGEDYHLQSGSPAIDACASGLTPDLDNIPRPFNGLYDMGAFEYNQHLIFLPIIKR